MIDTDGTRAFFNGTVEAFPEHKGDPEYDAIFALCDEVDRLRAENDDLKDALEYYADEGVWRKTETGTEYNTYIEYVWDWTRPPYERAQEVLDKFAEEK